MLRSVEVENGLVQGLPAADPRVTSFKGIPFAAPPVGQNRWRAPQPAPNWSGVYKAFTFAPVSVQAPLAAGNGSIYDREWNVDPDVPMDEDCLYLNIWTPAKCADEKLPVYVWYFGGAFTVGNTAEMEFDGERIARRGIIVVTVNYRLNAFGFLCHPEMEEENRNAPGNFGLLDQQAATRWVKRNIAAFGGDPERITVGGQSAGGISVACQMACGENRGLFQRAIIQSGLFAEIYPWDIAPTCLPIAKAQQAGVDFFRFLGVSSLAEARRLDTWYIRDKMLAFCGSWGPVIDSRFLSGDPLILLRKNESMHIPLLLGHTASEFLSVPNTNTPQEFQRMARELFAEHADDYLKLCGASDGDLSDACRRASMSGLELAVRLIGEDAERRPPLYYYVFDAPIPGWDNPGTFHSVDLWFFFETLAKCWRPFVGMHYDLARKMCNYWANFIRSGDPNGTDADGTDMPRWHPYTPAQPFPMRFGSEVSQDTDGPSPLMSFLLKRRRDKPFGSS